jgi:hypothetical protein
MPPLKILLVTNFCTAQKLSPLGNRDKKKEYYPKNRTKRQSAIQKYPPHGLGGKPCGGCSGHFVIRQPMIISSRSYCRIRFLCRRSREEG